MRFGRALLGVLIFTGLAFESMTARAQDHVFLQGRDGPTIDEYVKQWRNAKVVPPGSLKIDGRTVNCGKRPTVLNSYFDSWGGAFPGFLILNIEKINRLSTAVKLYIYSHECGHQIEGPDETKADLFAITRGVKRGWLDSGGMEEICTFISRVKGDSVHPPGPARCKTMRKHYVRLIEGGSRQSASESAQSVTKQKANTLAPQQ